MKLPTIVDPLIIDTYLPIIGSTAFTVYVFYLSRADPKSGECCVTIRYTSEHCRIDPKTVLRCNEILLQARLIAVFTGNRHIPNVYKILHPKTTINKIAKEQITKLRRGVRYIPETEKVCGI